MYDIVFINQKQCSLDILKLISIKQIDRNFKLTPPFLNEAGLLSHDFEKELLTKKVTVRKMPYLPPTTNSFASDSYDHQLKKFTKDVSNHTLQGLDPWHHGHKVQFIWFQIFGYDFYKDRKMLNLTMRPKSYFGQIVFCIWSYLKKKVGKVFKAGKWKHKIGRTHGLRTPNEGID